jgi:hypothetical protein
VTEEGQQHVQLRSRRAGGVQSAGKPSRTSPVGHRRCRAPRVKLHVELVQAALPQFQQLRKRKIAASIVTLKNRILSPSALLIIDCARDAARSISAQH